MTDITVPCARQKDIVVQQSNDDVLVYDLMNNKVFCLNETSAAIWQLCDGKRDITAIANQFQKQSNQQIPTELVELALENLSQENLLENYHPRALMNKTSRRAMIRKVGLATAAALPVITSLVAPESVAAQSCGGGLTFCPTSNPFGYPMPAGCYDLQNGHAGIFPDPILVCTHCGWACTSGMCVGGICQPL